jgi:hypothetical protein
MTVVPKHFEGLTNGAFISPWLARNGSIESHSLRHPIGAKTRWPYTTFLMYWSQTRSSWGLSFPTVATLSRLYCTNRNNSACY